MSQSFVPPQSPVPGFDPQALPGVPLADAPSLRAASLDLDFIRHTFAQPVPWEVEPRYGAGDLAPAVAGMGLRAAAVFMPLVQRASGVHLLFTRRSPHLQVHAGQICFPGGSLEPGDADAAAAAMRETREEIGVAAEFMRAIGRHPDYITRTRYAVTPIIGELRPGFHLRPDAAEVAEVFEVPLSVLLDPQRHRLHRHPAASAPGLHYFSISWRQYFIWGATAALVRNFYRHLLAAQAQDGPQ